MKKKTAKVLFINMPLRESAPPNCVPYGVLLLAAIARSAGSDVSVVDLNVYRGPRGSHITHKEAEAIIERHLAKHGDQDVVGVSGMITTLRWQTRIAKTIKRLQPGAVLVSGGGLASEFGGGLFNYIPELDAVATGEGDTVIKRIIDDAMNGRVTPKLIYVGERPPCLNTLPLPAYDLLESDADGGAPLETYLHNQIWGGKAKNSSETLIRQELSINTISSRGCPFSCKYCFKMATGGRKYDIRTARNVANEIAELKRRYKVDFVGMLDDNFMVNRERIMELPTIFRDAGITDVKWGTHGRLDEAADLRKDTHLVPRRVDRMAEAGCVYVGFGGESASAPVLKSMGKGGFTLANGTVSIGGRCFPKTYVEGIKNTKRAGITANCTWIMGYPGETLEDLKTTVAFMKWQAAETGASVNKSMFIATAYPGTEMFRHPKVAKRLVDGYGINFSESGPVVDENLRRYVLDLDDATKVLVGKDGRPMNFSDMDDKTFLKAKELIENGETEKILEMAA